MLRAFCFILVDFCTCTFYGVSKFLKNYLKVTKTEILEKKIEILILKIKFFGQLFLEIEKFFFLCLFGCWKNPYQPKKSNFLKILHPLASPASVLDPDWLGWCRMALWIISVHRALSELIKIINFPSITIGQCVSVNTHLVEECIHWIPF
jgi:hypothetical protein